MALVPYLKNQVHTHMLRKTLTLISVPAVSFPYTFLGNSALFRVNGSLISIEVVDPFAKKVMVSKIVVVSHVQFISLSLSSAQCFIHQKQCTLRFCKMQYST